jgi:hypothetical protein
VVFWCPPPKREKIKSNAAMIEKVRSDFNMTGDMFDQKVYVEKCKKRDEEHEIWRLKYVAELEAKDKKEKEWKEFIAHLHTNAK